MRYWCELSEWTNELADKWKAQKQTCVYMTTGLMQSLYYNARVKAIFSINDAESFGYIHRKKILTPISYHTQILILNGF